MFYGSVVFLHAATSLLVLQKQKKFIASYQYLFTRTNENQIERLFLRWCEIFLSLN